MSAAGYCDVSANSRCIGELALGHTVNTVVLGYAFDYMLYPFAIWKLGLL